MRIYLGILFSIFFFSASAQELNETAWKYAQTITASELKEHLYIVASDEMQGRETGKKGQKMAMEYLIKNFKSYGIDDYDNNKYKQAFPLIEQENNGVALTINGKDYELNEEYSISPNIIMKTKIGGELICVGLGIEEDGYNSYQGLNVTNKAVLIIEGKPKKAKLEKEWTIKDKIALAKEKGAAVVFYESKKLGESLIKYEHYFSKPKLALVDDIKEKEAITIGLTAEVTERLLESNKIKSKKLKKKGIPVDLRFSMPMQLMVDKQTTKLTSENVLAYIPGVDQEEEVLVITAHYDHIGIDGGEVFNGADDDGTGTVSLLEIAQAFQQAVKEGHQPKRSVLIMPVSGEEKGLLGSKYYTNHPIFPLENTVANLNIDMIGRLDENHKDNSNYVYLIGSDKLSADLHELSEETNKASTELELDYTFNDENDPNRFYYRSDHYNFAKNNIPVIFYFSGVHEDYHKATDTADKIDYDKTEKIARLVFMTAWEIANREDRLKLDE